MCQPLGVRTVCDEVHKHPQEFSIEGEAGQTRQDCPFLYIQWKDGKNLGEAIE